jgi:hypothetical protein
LGKFQDLTGQRFGRLTVIKRGEDHVDPHGHKVIMWECLCDCQLNLPKKDRKTVIRVGSSLKRGTAKSCGCLHKEIVSKTMKKIKSKNNIYDLTGSFGLCYDENKEHCWKFDLEDYELIKEYYWHSINGYACATDTKTKTTILMHRIIMNCLRFDEKCVDHINHNVFDNRKQNLRICTNFQNNANKNLRKDNTSGTSGVVLDKRTNKWVAQILINRKHIHLGVFENFNDAIRARKNAEEKYYGEFSYDNSIKIISEVN